MFVIHKSSRSAGLVSYNGPAWDNAQLRGLRQDTYKYRNVAETIALLLTQYNPVGFEVSEPMKPEERSEES